MHKNHPLEITEKHLIYTLDDKNNKNLRFARDVKVGEFLVTASGLPSRVRSIRKFTRNGGLYTPMTVSGDIMVSGVQASSYTNIDCLEGFISEQTLHMLSHGAMAPYRLYCSVTGGCQDETYDKDQGLNPWIRFLSGLQDILMDDSSSWLAKASIVLFGAVPVVLFVILGKVMTISIIALLVQLGAALVGYFIIWKSLSSFSRKNKDKQAKGA